VKLLPLFDGELHFAEETSVHISTYGLDSDWVGYVNGTGTISGPRLQGTVRWSNHPRRREDGMWLPAIEGVIEVARHVDVLFALRGYNYSLTERFEYTHRAVLGGITFRTASAEHMWLNDVFGVFEGVVSAAPNEHWKVRAFECKNELARLGPVPLP
jgi:hypothetical protein